MVEQAKRPRSARYRTLPPDPASLVQMVRAVHRKIITRAVHVRAESHDYHARRGFQTLFEQRAVAWRTLYAQAPGSALALAQELGLRPSVEREVQS